MPSIIGFTFTAIPAGDGHCKTMEINSRCPHYRALNSKQEHHSMQHGNWLMIRKTTLLGLSLS